MRVFNPLSAKFIKWSNTLKQFVGKLPTNFLSVFDHFSGLALKGLRNNSAISNWTISKSIVVGLSQVISVLLSFRGNQKVKIIKYK